MKLTLMNQYELTNYYSIKNSMITINKAQMWQKKYYMLII